MKNKKLKQLAIGSLATSTLLTQLPLEAWAQAETNTLNEETVVPVPNELTTLEETHEPTLTNQTKTSINEPIFSFESNPYRPTFTIETNMVEQGWIKLNENTIRSKKIESGEITETSYQFTLSKTTTISFDYEASSNSNHYGLIKLNGVTKKKFSYSQKGSFSETLTPGTYTLTLVYDKTIQTPEHQKDAVFFSNFRGIEMDNFALDYQIEYKVNDGNWTIYSEKTELPFEGGEVSVRTKTSNSYTDIGTYLFESIKPITYSGGNGTETSPYLISNAEELALLRHQVSVLNIDTTNTYYRLTNDIDFEGFDIDDDESNGNWLPIGENGSIGFKGIFDGGGHTIRNMIINTPDNYKASLFGYIYAPNNETVIIKNLNLSDAYVFGCDDVGLIAASVYGSYGKENILFENLKVSGFLKSSDPGSFDAGGIIGQSFNVVVRNVDVDLEISGYNYLGGIIGNASYGTIQKAKVNMVVNKDITFPQIGGIVGYINREVFIDEAETKIKYHDTTKTDYENIYLGGIVGTNYGGTVKNSSAELDVDLTIPGYVLGGVVAYNQGVIEDCYATGTISATMSMMGGVVGFTGYDSYTPTIKNAYSSIEWKTLYNNPKSTSFGKAIGKVSHNPVIENVYVDINRSQLIENIIGDDQSGVSQHIVGLNTEQLTGKESLNHVAFDFNNVWLKSNQYPILRWQNQAPVITAENVKLFVGDEFNALDYATVTDDCDETVQLIVLEDQVKPSEAGTYTVTYYAKDSLGKETTKTITVEVIKKTTPVIHATDVILTKGDTFNALDYASASDETDGPLEVTVVKDTVNPNEVGVYQVTYQVTNSFDVVAEKTINVTVKDKIVPPTTTPSDEIQDEQEENHPSSEQPDNSSPTNEKPQPESPSNPHSQVETGLWMSGLLLMGGVLLTGIGTLFGIKKVKGKKERH